MRALRHSSLSHMSHKCPAERLVETLAAGGESLDLAHVSFVPFLSPLVLPDRGPRDVPFGALLARFPAVVATLRDGAFGALPARLATIVLRH